MALKTIAVKVTNALGLSTDGSHPLTVADPPVISAINVTPDPAPANTLRTITVSASDPQNLALTYAVTVDGVAATQDATDPTKFTITV